tara:strand:+ start:1127 stop:2329 length:1203 start_codon:yes stop_codon:yes gene_type:complete
MLNLYLTNYQDLEVFSWEYDKIIKTLKKEKKINNDLLDYHKAIVCISAIDKNVDLSVKKFSSNRYFQDAIKIELNYEESTLKKLVINKNLCEINNFFCKKFFPNKKILDSSSLKTYRFISQKIIEEHIRTKDTFISAGNPEKEIFSIEEKNFFNQNGYLIIKNYLNLDVVESLREKVLSLAKDELDHDCAYLYGKKNSLQRIYNLLNKDLIFHSILNDKKILRMLDKIFDRKTMHQKFMLSSYHANIIPPMGEEQTLHIDSAVPEPIPRWIIRANINFLLNDFTEKNGATVCVPGSHKFFKVPKNINQKDFKFKKLIAPKGSLIIWSGTLWHKSGNNASKKSRIALLSCFASSVLKEMVNEEDYGYLLDKKTISKSSKDIKSLIGFRYGLKKGSLYKNNN